MVSMIRNFAFNISKKMPGKNWPTCFISKYSSKLGSGFLKGFDLSRKKADSPEAYRRYFKLVCGLISLTFHAYNIQLFEKIDEYNISPQNSYNMDEKGFLIGVLRQMKRVFFKKAFKRGRIKGAGQDGSWE